MQLFSAQQQLREFNDKNTKSKGIFGFNSKEPKVKSLSRIWERGITFVQRMTYPSNFEVQSILSSGSEKGFKPIMTISANFFFIPTGVWTGLSYESQYEWGVRLDSVFCHNFQCHSLTPSQLSARALGSMISRCTLLRSHNL